MATFTQFVVGVVFGVAPYLVVLHLNIATKKLRGDPLTRWEKFYDERKSKL